jgi:hypothetical protein
MTAIGLRLGAALVAAQMALAASQAAPPQQYPPAFPRQNAVKLLETERIVVWDLVWPKGQPSPLHRHVFDQVGTYYQAGGRAITPIDGPRRENTTPVGNISTTRKGTTHVEEGTTDPPLRAVFIELKRETAQDPAVPAPTPPRNGARQAHVEDRVSVWDFTWPPAGAATPVRYERDTLVVWLAPGTFRIGSDRSGDEILNVRAGSIRYRPRGTVETEELTAGSPRAMIFVFR